MQALQFNVTIPQFIAAKGLAAIFGRQIFYRSPLKTIRMVEIPEPTLPSPDWVKLRTIYCGFCGSDLNLICLHDSPTASPFTSFPCVIGHEIVGEIIAAGTNVQDFKPGDRVAINPGLACATRGISPACPSCQSGRSSNCLNFAEGDLPAGMFTGINHGVVGGFAPYLVAHRSQLYRVPDQIPSQAAVMTEPLAVALQTLFDNRPEDTDKILVVGGGVIGNLIVQAARVLTPRCHISVVEPSPFAAELIQQLGADEIISTKDIFPQTASITGARIYKPLLGMEIPMGGFDRVYDTVGHAATLNMSLRVLTTMGTLSIVGIGGDVKLDLTPLWLKLQTVKGVYAYGMATHNGTRRHVFDIALDLMRKDHINAAKLVTHEFALADFQDMLSVNLNKSKHRAIKTVVAFGT